MLRGAMRVMSPVLLLLVLAGCEEVVEVPLSYGRCNGAGACGLETRCEPVTLSTTGAAASLCTLPCSVDRDCPGLEGTCVRGIATTPTNDGGSAGRCVRACNLDADCRPGTVCRDHSQDAGSAPRLCVPLIAP